MTSFTFLLVVICATLFTLCDSLSKVQAGRKQCDLNRRFAWIALSILIFTICDSLSKMWGLTMSFWPLLGIIISTPAAYFLFGRVTRDTGLAVGSSVINAGNVVSAMIVGIIFFSEWERISTQQYVGMLCAIIGIVLMLFTGAPCDEVEQALEADFSRLHQRGATILLCILPPLTYMIFGVVNAKIGLAIGSGSINCMNLLGTMLVGLIALNEWKKVSPGQYGGMASSAAGLVLMLFY